TIVNEVLGGTPVLSEQANEVFTEAEAFTIVAETFREICQITNIFYLCFNLFYACFSPCRRLLSGLMLIAAQIGMLGFKTTERRCAILPISLCHSASPLGGGQAVRGA